MSDVEACCLLGSRSGSRRSSGWWAVREISSRGSNVESARIKVDA